MCFDQFILLPNIFAADQRIADQEAILQLFPVHIDSVYPVISSCGVIIYAFSGIAAGGIDRLLVFPLPQPTATLHLLYSAKNIKKSS